MNKLLITTLEKTLTYSKLYYIARNKYVLKNVDNVIFILFVKPYIYNTVKFLEDLKTKKH